MVIDPDGGCDDGKGNLVACPDEGPGIPHQLDEIAINVVRMKPASSYDYSQNVIPGKFQQDWNYILNGFRGNMFTRYGGIFSRDWNASSAEDREGAIEAVTSIIPGGFFIKGSKTIGKGATTVLGHHPAYTNLANKLNANAFNVPTKIWKGMSGVQRWGANQKFLDRMILRGDKIRLATPLNQVRPGSFYQKELNYLFSKGYRVSSDGLHLVK